ncbi:hypothetical protein PV433_27380 [Paenibacillus sp. GYB004]|uniref:hypothetical protein n=1 Tax=Paenibacillus sp. GYB004 TaxID=2994393 RepID=UPI002F9656E7
MTIPTLKDVIASDATTFLNLNEFAEKKSVDGNEITILIDDDELQKRRSKATNPSDGIYSAVMLFYAFKTDFAARPIIGKHMKIDNRTYRVSDVQDDDPVMYTIILERTGS